MKFDSKFVGCYSLRFNLEVQDYVKENAKLVDRVYFLMKKLSKKMFVAKMRN